MLEQIIQIAGSLLILAAFIAAQRGWLNPTSKLYLVLNLVGSTVLAIDAAVGAQWGFLLLEGVWAIVSLAGLIGAMRGKAPTASTH